MAQPPDRLRRASGPALFDLSGRVAVVTGGSGALGSALAAGLDGAGARVAVVARRPAPVAAVADAIVADGGEALGVPADVGDHRQLVAARQTIAEALGPVDVLVTAAGGNLAAATVAPGGSFFDLDPDAVRQVVEHNVLGTVLPVQVFGAAMAERHRGSIVTISSLAADRPLSRVGGYGAAKAAVENLTRWLADHVARRFGPGIRVNALAPGFFLGAQNRALLTGPDGTLSERGQAVVARTPLGRLGDPDDLVGPAIWLVSEASRFVTGAVVPVDGGFSAAAGL